MRPIVVRTTASAANAVHIHVVHVGRSGGGAGIAPPSEKMRDMTNAPFVDGTSIERANIRGGRNDLSSSPSEHPVRKLACRSAFRAPALHERAFFT
jgi:hypothetical protein